MVRCKKCITFVCKPKNGMVFVTKALYSLGNIKYKK